MTTLVQKLLRDDSGVSLDDHQVRNVFMGMIVNSVHYQIGSVSKLLGSKLFNALADEKVKHDFVVHAETNAVIFGKGDTEDGIAFVTLTPCKTCAAILAQVRVHVTTLPPTAHARVNSGRSLTSYIFRGGTTTRTRSAGRYSKKALYHTCA